MLDFMYHGNYDVDLGQRILTNGRDDIPTKLEVLSHLFCYAIAESYQVQELGKKALTEFSNCLQIVSPTDFADLMDIVAAHTQAKPVNVALCKVAFGRKDEMASCARFMKVLRGDHIPDTFGPGVPIANELRAAKQLACHGATLFRLSNRAQTMIALEHNKLVQSHQVALQETTQLRAQMGKDLSTLALSEKAQNEAKTALEASGAAEKQAKEELVKATERASRATQAMQKMKLELEVLRNAEHNRKRTLDGACRDASTPSPTTTDSRARLSPDGTALQKALAVSLEATRAQAVRSQQEVADAQVLREQHEKTLAELASVVEQRDTAEKDQRNATQEAQNLRNENVALQESLTKTKQQHDKIAWQLKAFTNQSDLADSTASQERERATEEQKSIHKMLLKANQDVSMLRNQLNQTAVDDAKVKMDRDRVIEEHKTTERMLEKANQEIAGLHSRLQEVAANDTSLHKQISKDHLAMSRGAMTLQTMTQATTQAMQQQEAVAQQATDASALRTELNVARLSNFTLQRSLWDLQFLILNNAENMQQLFPQGTSHHASQ